MADQERNGDRPRVRLHVIVGVAKAKIIEVWMYSPTTTLLLESVSFQRIYIN